LIDAQGAPSLPNAKIVLVLSNRKAAYGITRAQNADPPIPTQVLALQPYLKTNPGKTRDDYDYEVSKIVLAASPDLIVLAGWMHVFTDTFLKEAEREDVPVINLHPALPGAFDGVNSIKRAFEAFGRGEIEHSGVMVHKVIREVDRGEPVLVKEVEIKREDTLEDFEQRLHQTEWGVIVQATKIVLESRRYESPFQRFGSF
jgi:formyltetrahydrofolate-dependent phosphoribosylglycinamide formyltransferase